MLSRRQLFAVGAACLASPAPAQDAWPSRPIRIVVPFPPGQGADVLMRVLAEHLAPRLGQPVVVDNRAGAGGTAGTEYVAKSPPDGYTLGMGASGPVSIAQSLYPRLGYDGTRDITPIALIASVPQLFVVGGNSRIRDLQGLIAAARAESGGLFYGSSGNGSTQHLFVEYFAARAGIRLTHVPYRGSGPAVTDLLAGQIPFMSDTLTAVGELVRSGRIRAIAVTSAQRSPFFPDVPTVAEQGVPDFEALGWIGLFGPAGLPRPIAERVAAEVRQIVGEPTFQDRMRGNALTSAFLEPDAFGRFIAAEVVKWGEVVRSSGARIDE